MKIPLDEDIHLQLLVPSFSQELFGLIDENREYLKQWLAWLNLVESSEDTVKFIETAIHQHNVGEASTFAILHHNELCGLASLSNVDFLHKSTNIGYWLAKRYTGKGIATRAVKGLMDIAFVENRLNKIEIRCAQENTKSRAIPERLGFVYEATLRQCEWLYDRYVDHAVYTMLSSEYKSRA